MADLGEIVGLVAERLGPVTRSPQPLHGGITNHNFRVRFGDRDCVLRMTGHATDLLGIDRGSELMAGEMAAALGIGPAVLDAGSGYVVTEYVPCAPIEPRRLRTAPEPVARALRAFHDSGLALTNRFWVPDLLDRYARVAVERGGVLPPAFDRARAVAAQIAAALPLHDPAPCHDDLLGANLLVAADDPERVMLVDWEYAGMGHRLFDLGNLAVNNDFDDVAQTRLLQAYDGAPPSPERRAALALMQMMSDAREAAWGVVQAAVSELEFDFGAYARRHFARLQSAADDPRYEGWLHGATA